MMCTTTDTTGDWSRDGDWEGWGDTNCSEGGAVGVAGEGEGGLSYGPDLPSVYSSLKWIFILHAYGFGCLFFFLAFYSFFSILNLRSQLSTRPYMTTINSFLCLLGASRAALLFIDPYGLKRTLPGLLTSLLADLPFPSLISSFSLIQVAFLQLCRHEGGGEEGVGSKDSVFGNKTCLSVLITLHFSSVIMSAIYTNFNPHLMVAKLITQLVFALWALLLCGSFAYAGKGALGRLGPSPTSTQNDKGIANLFGMGMMGRGQNLASSLTAALAPTLLQSPPPAAPPTDTPKDTPKIKIIDENERILPSSNDLREAGGSGGGYVRPPSPVLPRRKSSGPGLRATPFTCRRPSRGEEDGVPLDIRKKSLTWSELDPSDKSNSERRSSGSRKSIQLNPNEGNERGLGATVTESLLGESVSGGGPDYTLQSILSHIAYVNQTALDYRLSRKLSRKNQVEKVLKYTSVVAVLGLLLSLGQLIGIIGPSGLLAPTLAPIGVWPWFILQTLCRITEFGMGATVANISKQPANPPHHYAYSIRHKHQRESLYL